jgi:hypothetical protein
LYYFPIKQINACFQLNIFSFAQLIRFNHVYDHLFSEKHSGNLLDKFLKDNDRPEHSFVFVIELHELWIFTDKSVALAVSYLKVQEIGLLPDRLDYQREPGIF